MSFAGRVAVVTGAAGGLGIATVEAFLREGARVAGVDVAAAGPAVAAPSGTEHLYLPCDVSQGPAVAAAFAAIRDRWGRVDFLINNAGVLSYGRVTEASEEEWDRTMGVNVKGAFLCAKHAIPLMPDATGVVINVASVQAFVSQPRVAAYTTSKTALLGLTRSIAVDYAPGIRCHAVCPGTIETPMLWNAAAQSPEPAEIYRELRGIHLAGRLAQPAEVAALILFLCRHEAAFMTGQPIRIDGGIGLSVGGSKCET